MAHLTIKITYPNVKLDFFPEGGDLVVGLSSNVAFIAQDTLGNPLQNITGQIIDQNSNLITKITTIHEGVGIFNLTPKKGIQYKAVVNFDDRDYEFELPTPQEKGMVLKVNGKKEDYFFIDIQSSKLEDLEEAFLVGHTRGEPFCLVEDLVAQPIIKIAKADIPEGVAHFTLFHNDGRPEAERLVYNDYASSPVSLTIQEEMVGDSLMELELSVGATFDTSLLNLSASITDPTAIEYPAYEMDIKNYLLLNSDLDNTILNPGQYLWYENMPQQEQLLQAERRFYLDLILMTKAWRRFKWKDLVEDSKKEWSYNPEVGYSIQGYVTKKDKEERVEAQVMINSLEANLVFQQSQTDGRGNFNFTNLPALDSVTYILQGRIGTKKEGKKDELKLEGNRELDFHLTEQSVPKINLLKYQPPNVKEKQVIASFLKKESPSQKIIPFGEEEDWQIDLDEISVTARRQYNSSRPGALQFFLLDNMEWIPPSSMGTGLLSRLSPRLRYIRGHDSKLYFIGTDKYGAETRIPVVISIDGMGAEPGGSNATPFLSLTADDIESIYVGGNAIAVTTRRIPRTLEAYLDSGILHIDHPGYSQAREFNNKVYAFGNTATSTGTAILWEPNLSFDDAGKAKLSIPYPRAHSYEINIEGITLDGQPIVKKQSIFIQKK